VLTFWAGCAGQAQPPSEPSLGSRQRSRPLREEFDPQSLREDLLLIQPVFPPPESTAWKTAPAPAADGEPAPVFLAATDSAAAGNLERVTRTVYRVQLMALSNGEVALERRAALAQELGVPVYVDQARRLFLVRAGNCPTAEEAERLKDQVVALSPEYADAYVVVTAIDAEAALTVDRPEETDIGPTGEQPSPVLVPAFGWRILIDQFLSHEQAERLKRDAMVRLNRRDIDVTFKAPWNKVEMGNFRTEVEAQEALERIESRYPNALKVRSQILVPEEE